MIIDFNKLKKIEEEHHFSDGYLVEVLEIFEENNNDYPKLLDELNQYLNGITENEHDEGYQEGYEEGYNEGYEEGGD